ncbi:MAG: hypothetical protein ACOVNY_08445 [Chitinophagaceae bacterium]
MHHLTHAKNQAKQKIDAILNKDYATIIKFTHPNELKRRGGEIRMIATLKKADEQQIIQKIKTESIELQTISSMVNEGREMQCIIPCVIQTKMQVGKVIATSYLIGISDDSGNNWTFVDAIGRNADDIRKILPNLSKKIIVPLPKEPKFVY